MDHPAEWLRELGYEVETERREDETTWANLRSVHNPEFVVHGYGVGKTADDAIASAAERWRVEQIGTDNPRRQGDPLP